jgi:O-antigen/teichoic acid export membrane protein
MSGVRRSIGFSAATAYAVQGVELASILVLARILTPAEIGVFALGSVVLLLTSELRNFGVGQYIVSEPEMNSDKLRRALGMLIISAWGLGGALLYCAPILAEFYQAPGLIDVFQVTSIGFFIAPFIAIPYALLRREMAFDKILQIHSASSLVQALVTVVGALNGLSYMSMAWGLLAGQFVQLFGVHYFVGNRTSLIPSFNKLGAVMRYGTYAGFAGLFRHASAGASDLVLGRLGTMTDVAVFSRGAGLVLLFDRFVTLAVRPAVLPHFSDAYHKGHSMADMYLRAVSLQTGLAWPFLAGFSAAVLPLVRLLYGDQWDASVPVAQILVVWGALAAVSQYSTDALLAVGRPGLVFIKEVAVCVSRFLAIIIGVRYGLEGAAVAACLAGVLELVLVTELMRIAIGTKRLALIRLCGHSGFVAVATGVACHAAAVYTTETFSSNVAQVASLVVIGMGVWVITVYLVRHPLVEELERGRVHLAAMWKKSPDDSAT